MKNRGVSEILGSLLLVLLTLILATILTVLVLNIMNQETELIGEALENFQRSLASHP